jgi:hypothetical protein
MISCGCRFDEDGPDEDDDDDGEGDLFIDANGTTPLRTVIDLAPSLEAGELERLMQDFLDRRLFTVEQARARLAEDDMLARPGADLVRRALPR